jgi:hypothetical protein
MLASNGVIRQKKQGWENTTFTGEKKKVRWERVVDSRVRTWVGKKSRRQQGSKILFRTYRHLVVTIKLYFIYPKQYCQFSSCDNSIRHLARSLKTLNFFLFQNLENGELLQSQQVKKQAVLVGRVNWRPYLLTMTVRTAQQNLCFCSGLWMK